MENIIIFILGLILGAIIVLIINWLKSKDAKVIAQELISQAESQKIQDLESLLNRIKESFGVLSLDALSKNSDQFLKLANESLTRQTQTGEQHLEGKKKLIEQTLDSMKGVMNEVQGTIKEFESDRVKKFGELSSQLKSTAEQTERLRDTTDQLRSALASKDVRGQWGQRMAEDVLRLVGFIEGINYQKQKALDTTTTIPDFTFFLPQNLKVNMDVKFPLDNYFNFFKSE